MLTAQREIAFKMSSAICSLPDKMPCMSTLRRREKRHGHAMNFLYPPAKPSQGGRKSLISHSW
jgi:hypothetical protein